MKDVFNRRQRFSLRKYSIGVCSVLLGTALFAAGAQSASADGVTAPSGASTSASTEPAPDSTVGAEKAPSSTETYKASVTNVDQEHTGAAQEVKEQSESNKAAAKAEETAQPAPKAEETVKPLNVGSLPETALPVTNKAELSSKPLHQRRLQPLHQHQQLQLVLQLVKARKQQLQVKLQQLKLQYHSILQRSQLPLAELTDQ